MSNSTAFPFALLAALGLAVALGGCGDGWRQSSWHDTYGGSGCDFGTVEEGGLCVPEFDLEDAIAALPPCVARSPRGQLDIGRGCVDGVCIGTSSFGDVVGLWGEPEDVDWLGYHWPSRGLSVEVWWDSAASTDYVEAIEFAHPWLGTSQDGAGLGSSLRCFVEVYGRPSWAQTGHSEDGTFVVELAFWLDSFGVYGFYLYDLPVDGHHDGLVDVGGFAM